MAIILDHTIVPSNDRIAGAAFLGGLFDIEPETMGHFEALRINDQLTFDYETASRVDAQHYAFVVSDDEFDAIFERIVAQGVQYGSGPFSSTGTGGPPSTATWKLPVLPWVASWALSAASQSASARPLME